MRYIIVLLIFLSPKLLLSQEKKKFSQTKHKYGLSVGIGKNNGLGFTNIKIDRDYEVYLFQLQYNRSIIKNKLWGIEALAQPQFNFASFKTSARTITNTIELGANIALLIRLNLFKENFSLYGLIGSGPHLIASTPERQANGFIFSDNFFMGVNLRISDNVFLDIRAGKRHASNLNFQFPNNGINTFIVHFGIIKLL